MPPDYGALAPQLMQRCARALGEPTAQAQLKQQAEDFVVSESLGFEPDGSGSHALLLIEKRQMNTGEVAAALARFAAVKPLAVGYCGLKDRQAVSRQWFSVDLGNRADPPWPEFADDRRRVLQVARHRRKLRPGSHAANGFEILLRQPDGDRADVERRLGEVQSQGVPNYFESQRFGHDGNNLLRALQLFAQAAPRRDAKQGMYLSAARSFLFNEVLSLRVAASSWQQVLPGEAVMLDGSNSWFAAPQITADIAARVADFDLHPSAPLWGAGASPASDAALVPEQEALAPHPALCAGLEKFGLRQERRPLRLRPRDLQWQWTGAGDLQLSFQLPPGGYATAVVRELVRF